VKTHPNPFTLIHDALLRPAGFAAFLDGGWRNIAWAALATAEGLLVALGFVALVLRQLVPLGTQGLAAGLLLAPLMALMFSAIWVTVGADTRIAPRASAAFWIARCQIALTPPLALLLALAYSPAFPQLARSTAVGLLLLLMFGVWSGGALVVALVKHPQRAESATARWVLALGALAIAGALWWSPPLRGTHGLLLMPMCLGFAAGLLRPVSYVCEAIVSLALLAAARAGASPLRLLALHPANVDDLSLLPLPGLGSLLVRAFAADADEGGEWILRVARHAGQHQAVRWVVAGSVVKGALAHPLLFWLSTSDGGVALLRDLADRPRLPHPLIAAYAAIGATATAAAWPSVIAQLRAPVTRAAGLPGGAALLALLEAGASVLRADRWPAAIAGLRSAPAPRDIEDDPIWVALDIVRTWADRRLPELADDRATALRALWNELQDLEGWPAGLIAAMSEHLLFLLGVEQRRGGWLV
jgi:hypothetical protein